MEAQNNTEKPAADEPVPQFIGKKTGVEISKAAPEDITSENYPNIIESFVFPNADLKDVIKAMSTDLNINIIMSPDIANKKISIISYSPITVAEAYQAFLSALTVHNLTMIRSGSFYKIVPSDQALKTNSPIYRGSKEIKTDQFVTRIFKLKYIDANTLETKIKPFMEGQAVKSLIIYEPSNMIIISDYGLNVEKIRKIIMALDVPSKDSIFKVIPIKHAQAKELSDILSNLLNIGRTRRSFRRPTTTQRSPVQQNKINITSLQPDERTNSIIVMGNTEGLKKVENLVKQLDTYKDPDLAGGIFVYKVKHGTAKELADTLNEVMGNPSRRVGNRSGSSVRRGSTPNRQVIQPTTRRSGRVTGLQNMATAQAFKDIRIIAEENTNTLLIVANKFDYEHTILNILKSVDISRNQVFVKAIIMEMNSDKTNEWQIGSYYFPEKDSAIPRIGYGTDSLSDFLSLDGRTLMFPLYLLNKSLNLNFTEQTTSITGLGGLANLAKGESSSSSSPISFPSLSAFIRFLQTTIGGDIVSTPQVIALDHQKATISITQQIPVLGSRSSYTNQGANISPIFNTVTDKEDIKTELEITPHINPDVNSVRLEIKQTIDNILSRTSK